MRRKVTGGARLGRARHVPGRAVAHGDPRSFTEQPAVALNLGSRRSSCRDPNLCQQVAGSVPGQEPSNPAAFVTGSLQEPRLWLSLKRAWGSRSSTVRIMKGSAAQDRAAERLRHWETGSRDDAVREAAAAGLILVRTQRITSLETITIMRIPGGRPDRACSPS
jgi:hypothetical protein